MRGVHFSQLKKVLGQNLQSASFSKSVRIFAERALYIHIHRPGGDFKLPYNIHTAETYCAPEILVYKRFNLDNPFAADLWSAGCAVSTVDFYLYFV